MDWDQVLAELTEKVEKVERSLDAEAWEELDATPFAPPDVVGEMTDAQRERAVGLLERVAACRRRLERHRDQAGEELASLDARRKGARSYASSDLGR